ncbi:MAG: hypothetical protein AB7V58_12935 [Solirubrobacterales bacterium]
MTALIVALSLALGTAGVAAQVRVPPKPQGPLPLTGDGQRLDLSCPQGSKLAEPPSYGFQLQRGDEPLTAMERASSFILGAQISPDRTGASFGVRARNPEIKLLWLFLICEAPVKEDSDGPVCQRTEPKAGTAVFTIRDLESGLASPIRVVQDNVRLHVSGARLIGDQISFNRGTRDPVRVQVVTSNPWHASSAKLSIFDLNKHNTRCAFQEKAFPDAIRPRIKRIPGPAGHRTFAIRDGESGLRRIAVTILRNARYRIPKFKVGTKEVVKVVAWARNPAQPSSVEVDAIDVAGNRAEDPIALSLLDRLGLSGWLNRRSAVPRISGGS